MKVLVSGGAGFIGSYLCEELLLKGHEVFIIDDLSTGSKENIGHLVESSKFHPFFETIMNETLLSELIDQCDLIFHLAAVVGVKNVIRSPVETIQRNVKGTELVLKFANVKKKKVFLTSTSEVYGKGNKSTFNERDDLTIGPTYIGRWSYACSKAIDEFLALAYWKEYKLPVIVVRLFNIIGPRQTGRYGMVMPRFIDQALQNKPITIYGDGKQTRCFLYVKDAVSAMINLAFHEGTIGEIFNLGNPHEISISNLAALIVKITGSKSTFQFIPYDQCYDSGFEDMPRRVPDIHKVQSLISFEPKTDLTEMIRFIVHEKTLKTSPPPADTTLRDISRKHASL
jgi:UDP-glucose 4-epimerase